MTTRSMPATAFHVSAARPAWATDVRVAGSLLFLAGGIILMGIISNEAFYPGTYSTAANEISDLGGTRPPDSVVLQPSATIFNLSMIAIGLLVVIASLFVHGVFRLRSVTIPIAILGAAALGLGLFPGNTGTPHAIFAMITFASGGIAAIVSSRVTTAPFRYLSILLGAVALFTLGSYVILGDASPLAAMGLGGLERWIVYPVVLWVTGFGGYLAGRADDPAPARIS